MSDPRPYVVTLGETLGLLHSSSYGSLAQASEMRVGIGGAESNVAIALARLDIASVWIGRVGADSLGERILRELRAEGVRLHSVVDPNAQTAVMLKERRTSESTRVWYYRRGSAGSRLEPADVPPEVVGHSALLHITGITPALSESAAAAVRFAMTVAAGEGIPISFDINHRSSLWRDRDAGEVYREFARGSQVVFAGEEEARLLVPEAESVRDLARGIGELGPTEVVIKRGAAGAYSLVLGCEYSEPAVPIRAVDTVGAGDAFVAGYLAEYLGGATAHARLVMANLVGAFACLADGDWEGLPRRQELTLLSETEPVRR